MAKRIVVKGLKDVTLERVTKRKRIKTAISKIATNMITSKMLDKDKVNIFIGIADGCSPFFEDLLDRVHVLLGDKAFNEYTILQSKIKISLYGKEFKPSIDRLEAEEDEFELIDYPKQASLLEQISTHLSEDKKDLNIIFVDDVYETGATLSIVNYWFKKRFTKLHKICNSITLSNVTFINKIYHIDSFDEHFSDIHAIAFDFNRIFPMFNSSEDLITIPDICGLNCLKDDWLVGYGMDLEYRFRNLKEIYKII